MKVKGLILLFFLAAGCFAQTGIQTNTLNGIVTLKESGAAVRNASVTIAELKSTVLTDENGKYQFEHIPPGRYEVIVHLDRVADAVKTVDLGLETKAVDFELTISGISEQVTVTASGSLESINNSYQSVSTV